MHNHANEFTTLHTFFTSIDSLLSPLTAPQRASKERGLGRYRLGEYLDSEADLTVAATAGDRESQYALGEAIRRRENTISETAKKWYRLAGAQNHVYSLLRLGDADSLVKARKLAQERADMNDGDAMLEMYELTKDIAWLKKAGPAGHGEALYILALLSLTLSSHEASDIDSMPADHKLPQPQDQMADAFYRAMANSANAGFPPAMYWLSNRAGYFGTVSCQPYQELWLTKRLEHNDLNAVLDYALALVHVDTHEDEDEDEASKEHSRYGIQYDLIKGYGLLWLVVSNTRQYSRHSEAAGALEIIETKLTPIQIGTAKELAQNWVDSYPPMSAYALTYSELTYHEN